MAGQSYNIREAKAIMARKDNGRPVPFSITYATWSESDQQGGEVRTIHACTMSKDGYNRSGHRTLYSPLVGHHFRVYLRLIFFINDIPVYR